jgi:beta-galactosidase
MRNRGGPSLTAEIPLDQGWRFGGVHRSGDPLQTPPAESWPLVDLPHCVVELSWHGWEPSSWEHRWLYQRTVDLPAGAGTARVLLDFDGVLSATTPTVNGHTLPETKGGYLPFTYEVTGLVHDGGNDLVVIVDGTWRQIPPSGAAGGAASVDYLQPAGISRHVGVRLVPSPAYVSDVFVSPAAPPSGAVDIPVVVTVDSTAALSGAQLDVQLTPHGSSQIVAQASAGVPRVAPGRHEVTVTLSGVDGLSRWSPSAPTRYDVAVTLRGAGTVTHTVSVPTGFRDTQFTPDGFFLNGERLILFGVNRHQLFPYMGMSAPDRLQRRDAEILKSDLNCNAVRCAHYPPSPAFLDACDALGILVWEEIPGWQYIGDAAWQRLWLRDVAAMVRRDRNRPSVVIWGVQPNESQPTTAAAARARTIAGAGDRTRPAAGTNTTYDWPGYVQPVFAHDDYTTAVVDGVEVPQLHAPIAGTPYLVAEAVGALGAVHYFVRNRAQGDLQTQAIDHGIVHSQARDPDATYGGLLGWAGLDYASLTGYTVDALKTPGVIDTFRVPKPGAAIYRAQVDPAVRPVIEPAFSWYFGSDAPVTSLGSRALVCTNCDEILASLDGRPIGRLTPAGPAFAHLDHPPLHLDTTLVPASTTPDLRLDGYVNGAIVLSRSFSADTSADVLQVVADDASIAGDGSDATRIRFVAVDRFGNTRAYAGGTVRLTLTGVGRLVGDNPFDYSVAGGVGAVWLRSVNGQYGTATVLATHAALGSAAASVAVVAGPPPGL